MQETRLPSQPLKIGEQLHAVTLWREHSFDGSIAASTWLMRLGEDAFGFMTNLQNILWFRDIAKRDEFMKLFGGKKVTMTKKSEAVAHDLSALRRPSAR